MALENGHCSPMDTDPPLVLPHAPRSDSELSDVNDNVPSNPLALDAQHEDESADEHAVDMATSASEAEEDAAGSEDADYAAAGSPPSPRSNASRHNSMSSETSSQPRKRKAEVVAELYMQENPELYGLRRSVRAPRSQPTCSKTLLTR